MHALVDGVIGNHHEGTLERSLVRANRRMRPSGSGIASSTPHNPIDFAAPPRVLTRETAYETIQRRNCDGLDSAAFKENVEL